MIASDDANPNFLGASNPDSRLYVRFYIKPIEHPFQTELQKKPVFVDTEFVHIEVPGNRLSIIDTISTEEHRQRFPIQYARFKNENAVEQTSGLPVEHWPLVTRSQAETLKAMKFRTVEQIAAASDAQIDSIGMVGGMAPYAFREKAQRFLAAAHDSAAVDQAAQENAALKEQIAALQRRMEELAPKKRGRPRKNSEPAQVT